jgi:hypothetical protein
MSTVDLLSRLGERFGSSIPLPLIFSPDGSVLNSEPGERLGHFAFAYHHIDPSNIMISIGKYAGQFWVKGKAPDLANIAGRGGGVKYELIRGPLASDRRA